MGGEEFNADARTCGEQRQSRCSGLVVSLISWMIFLLVGCQVPAFDQVPTPIMPVGIETTPTKTAVPTSSGQIISTPTLPQPTATINPDTGWQAVQPGLERRHIFVLDKENQPRDRLAILRLDPTLFDVRVVYRPGEAQSLETWQAETNALITINGGFFTEDHYATGLTVVDGEAFGVSYDDFAGMLAVTDAGTDVRWLRERPFNANEALQYAVQSFPVLVKPGGILGFPEEDGNLARRTVIGQDENGNLLFIIAPSGLMTLHQMSQWLTESDLNLHIALNLDGGPSTGLLLANSDLTIPAYSPLPAIITVHQKINN